MAEFGSDSIFKMLASQFLSPGEFPQAAAMSPMNSTAAPDFAQMREQGSAPILMNAVAPKQNALSSFGNMLGQIAPMIGAAMSQKADATSAMKNSPGTFKLPGDTSVGVALGSPGGYNLNLPALPTRR